MANGPFRSGGMMRKFRALRLATGSSQGDGAYRLLTILVLVLPLLLAMALQHRM